MKLMEGDSRNLKVSLLKKYDVPVEHLSYEYVGQCSSKKELERIIRILRSGEEGFYPDLLKLAEERLKLIAPDSRVLRIETPILTKECLTKEEWDAIENELFSWEEEMKIMDKTLDFEKGRLEVVGKKNMPEIRKVAQLQRKCISKNQVSNNSQEKSKTVSEKNCKRIKSGDYAAWDKFDVDKELLKIDVQDEREWEQNEKKKREAKKLEKKNKIELVDFVDKENYSTMEQEVLAYQAKDRGNECYKSGDLENSLKYYEISINLYPTAIAFNNRALAYLKLKQYKNCIKDCNKVLDLDKNNIKARLRRATAYQNMPSDEKNNYNQLALQDLYEIICLEPNNKIAQADFQKLKKKLNIEDLGKKFRMPICEELVDKKNKNQTEEKNITQNVKDDENLPLIYYGPSTSSFRCEPHSMIHRALSGSSIPGQVLCKCNSERLRQNPLCQRCGEAMSTPKPATSTSKKDHTIKTQKTNEVINVKIKGVENIMSETENNTRKCNNPVPTAVKNSVLFESKKNNNNKIIAKQLDISSSELENSSSPVIEVDYSSYENNTTCGKIKEEQVEKLFTDQIELSHNKAVKNVKSVDDKSTNEIITEKSPSQDNATPNTEKFKNNKKKSKDCEQNNLIDSYKIEPLKVIHAAKYLHPTSAKPRIKKETSADIQQGCNFSGNLQYKVFVPNKECCSTENKIMQPSAENNNVSNDFSNEGNKENIFDNKSNNNVENKVEENDPEEVKKEFVDSAYEFIKTWEELKKFDESYVKRAEILRRLRPSDLSRVIGIKLDSEMLSCLLECLLKHFAETEPNRVVQLLKELPQIPRFGLVSMFLGDADKKSMSKLVETIEAKGFSLDDSLKKKLTTFC